MKEKDHIWQRKYPEKNKTKYINKFIRILTNNQKIEW